MYKWIVGVQFRNGGGMTVEVFASTKEDAEYRALMKAEKVMATERVVACRRSSIA